MPLEAPVLDDRTFDDIVAEAKTRISRYTPEWTNHNESDPGITLVQLFAWMTELLIYRLNKVPDLNYVKFLQLLGIELNPAQPAVTDLTFSLSAEAPGLPPTEIIPLGTQVAVAGGAGDPPPVFETERAIVSVRARLAEVRVDDGFSVARVALQNAPEPEPFHPFGRDAREGSALYLGFASTLEFPAEQFGLMFYVPGVVHRLGTRCDALEGIPLPATVIWEYWDRRGEWVELNVVEDETRAFTRSGHVYVEGPGADAAPSPHLDPPGLYWLRARLVHSTYERSPRLESVLTNTVSATQAVTVLDEVLGGSDGSVGQRFRLSGSPVVRLDPPLLVPRRAGHDAGTVEVRSVQIEIDEGQGFEAWQEVDDFFASGPDDPHFVVNRTRGEIGFGDGQNGRIPVANPKRPADNVVARRYRQGGGTRGNSGAGTVTELQSNLPRVAGVTNYRAATGGTDEENLENAKARAPLELQSKGRAVTVDDFEKLAAEAPGARVARVKALPLVHPQFRDAQVPGVVTVIVVPESEAERPMPNETTLRAVCAHLNAHRLLTTEVYVVPPKYRQISIEANVIVEPSADLARVQREANEALTRYFAPLRGGDGQGWDFGADVYFSDVYRRILDVPGVDRVDQNMLFIWLGEERFGPCEDVRIPEHDLLYSGKHEIHVAYRERE